MNVSNVYKAGSAASAATKMASTAASAATKMASAATKMASSAASAATKMASSSSKEPAKEEKPATPEEATLMNQFLQKVRKGDLTDVVKSLNPNAESKPETDELTIFQEIKKKIKDGDFSDIIKSLPSPPPFPTAIVMQIISSLNDIFQQNIGKISKFAENAIDAELEKKKNELSLTKALGEQATKTNLEEHMPAYINHVMNK